MTPSIRLLTQSDFPAYDAFLVQHAETSMFLRSNARRVGLDALTTYKWIVRGNGQIRD